MNLIPKKYPIDYGGLMSNWTSQTLGGPDILTLIRWSRETYGIDWSYWSLSYNWIDVTFMMPYPDVWEDTREYTRVS